MKLFSIAAILVCICSAVAGQQVQYEEISKPVGTWWTNQYGIYREVIFTDSVMWSYADVSGVLTYNYELRKSMIERRVRPWNVHASSLDIVFIKSDSMKLAKFGDVAVYYRGDFGMSDEAITKLVNEDADEFAKYVQGYLARKRMVLEL